MNKILIFTNLTLTTVFIIPQSISNKPFHQPEKTSQVFKEQKPEHESKNDRYSGPKQ